MVRYIYRTSFQSDQEVGGRGDEMAVPSHRDVMYSLKTVKVVDLN